MSDTLSQEPADSQLYALTAAATKASLEYIASLEPSKRPSYLSGHRHWQKIEWQANGLPSFSSASSPINYYEILVPYSSDLAAPVRPVFEVLIAYMKSTPRLNMYFGPQVRADESNPRWVDISARIWLSDIVDRYIHVYKTTDFSEEQFRDLYLEFERGVLLEKLPVDVFVPILYTRFDFDRVVLADGVFLHRMDDDFQLARVMLAASTMRHYGMSIEPATHALVIKGFEARSSYQFEVSSTAYYASAYPTSSIDNFFAALRVVSGVDTGYSQLLVRPIGWIQRSIAHLPPIEGALTRKYPSWLDGRAEEAVPLVTLGQARHIAQLYGALNSTSNKKLLLAASRLNMCLLRENEADAVLDATIAMEALLSNDSQEVVHKLSLRLAALAPLSRTDKIAPPQVFRAAKRIYSYRSAVAHGNTPRAKDQLVTFEGIGEMPTIHAAVKLLRMALSVLAENQQYLDPDRIDEELLLGKL